MRVPITKDVDAGSLATQLSTALGIPVAVSSRNPGQKDDQGNPLPGVVVLLDGNTGVELSGLDLTKINAVIAAHVPPDPTQTPAKALSDALSGATTLPAAIAAIRGYADALVAREGQARQRGPAATP